MIKKLNAYSFIFKWNYLKSLVLKKIKILSGGEKSKLKLCSLTPDKIQPSECFTSPQTNPNKAGTADDHRMLATLATTSLAAPRKKGASLAMSFVFSRRKHDTTRECRRRDTHAGGEVYSLTVMGCKGGGRDVVNVPHPTTGTNASRHKNG